MRKTKRRIISPLLYFTSIVNCAARRIITVLFYILKRLQKVRKIQTLRLLLRYRRLARKTIRNSLVKRERKR